MDGELGVSTKITKGFPKNSASSAVRMQDTDDFVAKSMRPSSFTDFVGQKVIKENLSIFVQAAKNRKRALDHTILYGPPGLGKTTIASIIAHEMGGRFRTISGALVSKVGEMAAILSNMAAGDVLFIDEIHRLSKTIEEVLYPAMEDFKLDLVVGEGPASRIVRIDIPEFTIVAATTQMGMISSPLRDRFGIVMRLELYQEDEIVLLLLKASAKLEMEIEKSAALQIARASRGTPRIALRLLRRVSDFAQSNNTNKVDLDMTIEALKCLNIDAIGLDNMDYKYLNFILNNYNNSAVGVETLSAGIQEAKTTIEDMIEPYLIQQGLVNKTPRGRMLTEKAKLHLATDFAKVR